MSPVQASVIGHVFCLKKLCRVKSLHLIFTMRFHSRAKEKKEKGSLELVLIAVVVGAAAGFILILTGIGVKAGIKFLINNWIWAVALVFGFFIIKKFVFKGPKK